MGGDYHGVGRRRAEILILVLCPPDDPRQGSIIARCTSTGAADGIDDAIV